MIAAADRDHVEAEADWFVPRGITYTAGHSIIHLSDAASVHVFNNNCKSDTHTRLGHPPPKDSGRLKRRVYLPLGFYFICISLTVYSSNNRCLYPLCVQCSPMLWGGVYSCVASRPVKVNTDIVERP